MRYIVKRSSDGAYVAKSGSQHSYTRALQSARTYETREAAGRDCCENEHVTTVDEEMR